MLHVFIHSNIERHGDYFQFWAMMTKNAVSTFVFWSSFYTFLLCVKSQGKHLLVLVDITQKFSHVIVWIYCVNVHIHKQGIRVPHTPHPL